VRADNAKLDVNENMNDGSSVQLLKSGLVVVCVCVCVCVCVRACAREGE
jgi:hypothetical protein